MTRIVVLVPTVCWGLVAGTWCRRRLVRFGRHVPATQIRRRRPEVARSLTFTATTPLLVMLVLLLALVHPVLAAVAPLAVHGGNRMRSRTRRRRWLAAVVDQVPDLVDLLRLTTLAGLPVSAALVTIDGLPGGPLGPGLRRAVVRLSHGAPTVEALNGLADSGGAPLRPLIDALVDHDRYGTPLGPALDRVGIEARLHRRRASEEAARRLPVTLLFPLVFTTLPACGLLTVIPLLVASLSSLQP